MADDVNWKDLFARFQRVQTDIDAVERILARLGAPIAAENLDQLTEDSLIQLEQIQRHVGDVQVALIRRVRHAFGHQANSATAHVPAPGPATDASIAPDKAIAWLAAREITVVRQRKESLIDDSADRTATFLAHHFASLQRFYEHIKRHIAGNGRIYPTAYRISLEKGDDLSALHQWRASLGACGFLEFSRYDRSEGRLHYKPSLNGAVQSFFTGGWVERYVLRAVEIACANRPGEESVLAGAAVRFPNGTDGELDLLIWLGAEDVFWIECKTGGWQSYAERYRILNEQFIRVPPERAVLLLTQAMTPADRGSASGLSNMTVLDLASFPKWLEQNLAGAVGSQCSAHPSGWGIREATDRTDR